MSDSLIEIKKLNCGYLKKVIVKEASFELKKGEVLTIIGPNGCGKTTLLKTISNQLKPICGQLKLLGKELSSYSGNDLARLMSVVFTENLVRESISCREVVAFGRYPYTGFLGKRSEEDEAIIDSCMKRTNCLELADSDYTKLSDGQRQRVLLARALAQKPEILVLDEPTTYLDVKYQLEFLSLIKKLAVEENFGVIMSLHELDLARQISDRIICIRDGIIDKAGTPEDIFSKGYINNLFEIEVGNYDEESFRAVLGR